MRQDRFAGGVGELMREREQRRDGGISRGWQARSPSSSISMVVRHLLAQGGWLFVAPESAWLGMLLCDL